MRLMQETIAGHIYNGVDVSFKGVSAYGVKTSADTVDVDLDTGGLDIDFTSASATAEAIRAAWIALVNALRITNNVGSDITWYVSREIMSNFQRFYSTSDVGFGTILQELRSLSVWLTSKKMRSFLATKSLAWFWTANSSARWSGWLFLLCLWFAETRSTTTTSSLGRMSALRSSRTLRVALASCMRAKSSNT